jgi:hypothetical protein
MKGQSASAFLSLQTVLTQEATTLHKMRENMTKTESIIEFIKGNGREEEAAKQIKENGYKAVQSIVFQLENELRASATEADLEEWNDFFTKAKQAVPSPAQYSPSWDGIWKEFHFIYERKITVLAQIPVSERKGDWQVIFDNPYSTEGAVCHASCSLAEAAYLYAGYEYSLKKAEYVKLQKVRDYITAQGK